MILHPCVTSGVLSHQFPKLLDKTRFDDAAVVFIIKPLEKTVPTVALYVSEADATQPTTREHLLSVIKENPKYSSGKFVTGNAISEVSLTSIASHVIGGVCGFIGSYSTVTLGMGGRPKSDLDHTFDDLHRGLVVSAKILLDKWESAPLPQVVIIDVEKIANQGPNSPLTKAWIGYTEKM